jgi:hypothetical protein
MALSDRLRSRLGPKAAALPMIACGAGSAVLAPSAYSQASTAHPAITRPPAVSGGHHLRGPK